MMVELFFSPLHETVFLPLLKKAQNASEYIREWVFGLNQFGV